MLYKLNGYGWLKVEYSFYDADEGQPVVSLDIDSITDFNGSPVSVSRVDEVRIWKAAYRHLREESRKEWREFRDRALQRHQPATAGSSPAHTPTIPLRD